MQAIVSAGRIIHINGCGQGRMTNPRCDTYDIPDQDIPDEWWENGMLVGNLMWPDAVVQYKDGELPISDKETIGILCDQIAKIMNGDMTASDEFVRLTDIAIAEIEKESL